MTHRVLPFDAPQATAQLRTVGDLIRYAATQFAAAELIYGHGTSTAVEEAIFMVLEALKLPIDDPQTFWHSRLTESERVQLLALCAARIETRQPAPYLLNRAYIQGFSFYVDERVIIPRSYLAELLLGDTLYNVLPWGDDTGSVTRVLDLCTGSGCLAILAAHLFPHAQIDAVDISSDALAVAAQNVADHGMNDRVTLHRGDLWAPLNDQTYDLIITNPPYVDDAAMELLPPEYRAEPDLALAGGGDGGMDIVCRIIANAAAHLTPHGALLCELGQGRQVIEDAYPDLNLIWLDTENSASEVFFAQRADLAS